MAIHIHIHLHGDKETLSEIKSINSKIEIMAKKQSELAADLNVVTEQITKIAGESKQTLDKVKELEEALSNQDSVSPELQTAFDNLKAQVLLVDELIPDVTNSEEPTPPVEPEV